MLLKCTVKFSACTDYVSYDVLSFYPFCRQVVMAVPLLALWASDSSGKTSGGLTAFGTTAYAAIVLVVNLKVRDGGNLSSPI